MTSMFTPNENVDADGNFLFVPIESVEPKTYPIMIDPLRRLIQPIEYDEWNHPWVPNIPVPDFFMDVVKLMAAEVANNLTRNSLLDPAGIYVYNLATKNQFHNDHFVFMFTTALDDLFFNYRMGQTEFITNDTPIAAKKAVFMYTSYMVVHTPDLHKHLDPDTMQKYYQGAREYAAVRERCGMQRAQMIDNCLEDGDTPWHTVPSNPNEDFILKHAYIYEDYMTDLNLEIPRNVKVPEEQALSLEDQHKYWVRLEKKYRKDREDYEGLRCTLTDANIEDEHPTTYANAHWHMKALDELTRIDKELKSKPSVETSTINNNFHNSIQPTEVNDMQHQQQVNNEPTMHQGYVGGTPNMAKKLSYGDQVRRGIYPNLPPIGQPATAEGYNPQIQQQPMQQQMHPQMQPQMYQQQQPMHPQMQPQMYQQQQPMQQQMQPQMYQQHPMQQQMQPQQMQQQPMQQQMYQQQPMRSGYSPQPMQQQMHPQMQQQQNIQQAIGSTTRSFNQAPVDLYNYDGGVDRSLQNQMNEDRFAKRLRTKEERIAINNTADTFNEQSEVKPVTETRNQGFADGRPVHKMPNAAVRNNVAPEHRTDRDVFTDYADQPSATNVPTGTTVKRDMTTREQLNPSSVNWNEITDESIIEYIRIQLFNNMPNRDIPDYTYDRLLPIVHERYAQYGFGQIPDENDMNVWASKAHKGATMSIEEVPKGQFDAELDELGLMDFTFDNEVPKAATPAAVTPKVQSVQPTDNNPIPMENRLDVPLMIPAGGNDMERSKHKVKVLGGAVTLDIGATLSQATKDLEALKREPLNPSAKQAMKDDLVIPAFTDITSAFTSSKVTKMLDDKAKGSKSIAKTSVAAVNAPIVTSADMSDVMKKIRASRNFYDLGFTLEEIVKEEPADSPRKEELTELMVDLNDKLTCMVNEFIKCNLKLRINIDSFSSDATETFYYLRNKFGEAAGDAYKIFEAECMVGIKTTMADSKRKELVESLNISKGLHVDFLTTIVSVTNTSLSSRELGIDPKQLQMVVTPKESKLLFSILDGIDTYKESVETPSSKNFLVTREGLVYRCYETYFTDDVYMLVRVVA